MALQVQSPFQQFFDADGDPLDNGSIYIGQTNLNPQQYPIPIFWDQAGTIPALQPVQTLNGYAVRNGTPARIFVDSVDYSIAVRDSRGRLVFTALSVTAVTFSTLAAPTGSSLIGFQQAGAHTVARTLLDRGRDAVSIKDYANFATNAAQAITDMATDYGFVRIPFGNFPIGTSITIAVPLWFDEGAAITAAASTSVTINSVIESPRQFIFQGAGTYTLGHSAITGTGENAREIHASWFGAFPSAIPGPDQAPAIAKAMAAVGNLRESVLKFDMGNYNISSQALISRGTLFVGDGTRRTVFKLDNDGYSVFKTNGVAVKFQGIQFELHSGITVRNSPYIEIAHGECSVDDAYFTAAGEGILITSSNARITNLMAVYGSSLGAGSCLVHVQGGSNNHINGVLLPTSQFAPESIVRVGGTASTVSGTIVENLTYITPGIGVLVDAAGTVGRTTISRLSYNGGTVAQPDSLVTVRSSAAALVENVRISGLTTNSNSLAVVRLEHGSSADMRDITISDVVASGATAGNTGDGIIITRSGTGALKGVILADSINVRRRLNQLTITPAGALSESYISPGLLNDVEPSYVYTFSIADDTAVEIDFQRDMFVGRVDVAAGVSNYGQYVARSAPTPSINTITASANVNTLVSVLTGTTGVDGKLTVAPQPKKFYIENRLGSTQTVICVVSGTFA